MTTRRTLLVRAVAAAGGAAGLAFGSGAFTQVEADRNVTIGIDSDDQALLRIEPNDDLVGDAAEVDPDTGEFGVELDGLNPSGIFSLGAVDDLRDPTAITDEAFVVRATGEQPMELTVSLEDVETDTEIEVLVADETGDTDSFESIDGDETEASDTFDLDPDAGEPGDRAVSAILVDTDETDESPTAAIEFSAEIQSD